MFLPIQDHHQGDIS